MNGNGTKQRLEEELYERQVGICKAFANPTRLRILDLVGRHDYPASELDTVWESLEADALSLTDAQRAELDYRIARHEQNPSDVIPWQQVSLCKKS